jgi:hypothetical protein
MTLIAFSVGCAGARRYRNQPGSTHERRSSLGEPQKVTQKVFGLRSR